MLLVLQVALLAWTVGRNSVVGAVWRRRVLRLRANWCDVLRPPGWALHCPATAVFMINLSDSAGYIGTIVLVLYKNFGSTEESVEHLGLQIQRTLAVLSMRAIEPSLGLARCGPGCCCVR